MKDYQFIGYKLLSTTAVTSIVSQRIYHGNGPESMTYPAITYFQSGYPAMTYQNTISRRRYQIDCWANSAAGVRDLEQAVTNTMDNASGTFTNSAGSSFDIQATDVMLYGPMIYESGTNLYHQPIDIRLIYLSSANN
jgi:hypothetical protein